MNLSNIQALTFDVFGTVHDWRSTIIREMQQLDPDIDAEAFADGWRAGYQPAMNRVRSGELPWMNIDAIHRMLLDDLLIEFNITGMSEAEIDHLNRVWHRIEPWPDAREGLKRLRERFLVATLSNGNVALLTNMAKNADMRWDCILSAELAHHYKPDPEVYLTAASLLGLDPSKVMMIAAHNGDLKAAKAVGFAGAFVLRPTEFGPNQTTNLEADPVADVVATDFNDLADQLLGG